MRRILLTLVLLFPLALSAKKTEKTVGLHILNFSTDKHMFLLKSYLPDLKEMGVNTIFLEVDYNFDFKSHPELSSPNSITLAGAKTLVKAAKKHGVKIIPEFQHIGHQSWKANTQAFLTKYPQYDLTPGAFPNNEGIYCREWDLTNKAIDTIVFSMVDEIVAAFEADAIHIGADEVFLIGNDKSPNTKGKDAGKLYAEALTRFHHHYKKQNGWDVYMWGDRLIDGTKYGYGTWESSVNGTATAIDMIPKDIVICDWHYSARDKYPSVDLFLEKGFKVIPTSFKDVNAAKAFIKYSYALDHKNMAGHMFTMWGTVKDDEILTFKAMVEGCKIIKEKRFNDVYITPKGIDKENKLVLKLETVKRKMNIHYTLDGKEPTLKSPKYDKKLRFNKSLTISARAFYKGKPAGDIATKDYTYHKAIGKSIDLLTEPSKEYAQTLGEKLLVNGINLTPGFGDGEWLGFNGNNFEAIVDMKQVANYKTVSMNFNNTVNSWIHHPKEVYIYGSEDGKKFEQIGYKKKRRTGRTVVNITVNLETSKKIRYIKVKAINQKIPEGFNGEGNPAWIFVDEIEIQ